MALQKLVERGEVRRGKEGLSVFYSLAGDDDRASAATRSNVGSPAAE
ncbi:hypothetical protein [Streptomyces ochraceiscleroticus]|uniref:ArsR family transcriptional regulator n=1 Tax=Streptomyces ochraceiscleroticus TaxID=47761 RepID=A0ABW1MM00_9ACTN|nr:hypothetical protein [Streptomyces ochraceiscleroticus]